MKQKTNAFDVLLFIFMLGMLAVCILPFMNVIAESLSDEVYVIAGQVGFLPKGLNFSAYKYLASNNKFLNSVVVSVAITLAGTALSLGLAVITAYPLSLKGFRGKNKLMIFFVFAMLFDAGIVPRFLLMKTLGLINTIYVLFIPALMNIFNLFIMKSFLEQLPEELAESARMDGANNIQTLFKIILPLCKPVLATLTLFYLVTYWNDFFTAIMFVTDEKLKPLQLYLYELVNNALSMERQAAAGSVSVQEMNFAADSIRSAAVVLSTIPIIMVYPVLQRFFVKGLVLGSVKG